MRAPMQLRQVVNGVKKTDARNLKLTRKRAPMQLRHCPYVDATSVVEVVMVGVVELYFRWLSSAAGSVALWLSCWWQVIALPVVGDPSVWCQE